MMNGPFVGRSPNGKPLWMNKHPCARCGTGYGECAQGYVISIMCCRGCDHPTRWEAEPYTTEELADMSEQESR